MGVKLGKPSWNVEKESGPQAIDRCFLAGNNGTGTLDGFTHNDPRRAQPRGHSTRRPPEKKSEIGRQKKNDILGPPFGPLPTPFGPPCAPPSLPLDPNFGSNSKYPFFVDNAKV